MKRAQEGYLDAFEELARRHQGRAYAVALRMVGNAEDANDALQDSFIDAWRALARFQGDSSFGTWFYRIVVNRCLMNRRRHVPEPAEVLEAAGGAEPSDIVEHRLRDEALRRAIKELPDDQRAPLVLVTFADFSYDEAAAVLNIAASTVRGRVARARKTLLLQMRGWA